MQRKTRTRVTPTGAIVFAACGAACIGYGSLVAWTQKRMLSWPFVTARVESFDPGTDPTFMGNWYANPKVRFQYEVAGTRFEGSALNPSPFNYQSPSRFRAETDALKPGALVPCWYDPQRPANGYLINTGITTAPVVLVSAGLVCLSLVVITRFRRWDGGGGRPAAA